MTDHEAIERLKICEQCGDCLTCAEHDEAIKLALYAFKEREERAMNWISVDERLPESGVHVLLACKFGCNSRYVCDGFFAERWTIAQESYMDDDCAYEYCEDDDEYYLEKGWYEVIKNWDDYGFVCIPDEVTHWMPLPYPPKEEL